jgi:NADH:ubiquinone oxidoreductase subunit F (NADH-binding)
MADRHTLRAYLPGGASGGILPSSMDDIPLDFGTLEKYGCFIGSAAVIVLSEHDDIKQAALNLMRFFKDELWPVHPLPGRYAESGTTHVQRRLESGVTGRTEPGDAGRIHLWIGASGLESTNEHHQLFP